MRLLRESAWVRVFETESGDYYDSKFRTGECRAGALEWLDAWKNADEDERIELEAAFVFFPDAEGAALALEGVGAIDPRCKRSLASRWIADEDDAPARHAAFLAEYQRSLARGDRSLPVLRDEVLSATWFRVVRTIAGLEIEPKIAADMIVGDDEFREERDRVEDSRLRTLYDVWWDCHGHGRGRFFDRGRNDADE